VKDKKMEFKILKLVVSDQIATVTVSRPESLNALNSDFFREMDAMLVRIAKDRGIKVLIITGEGKAFVAGADIAEMVDKSPSEGTEFSRIGQNTFRSMEMLDIPIIAAINGFALGGGLEFAMACDIRIASSKAKFGQPEVNLGVTPGYAGTQRLPRLVGLGNALLMLLTGDMFPAADALRMGLVQQVTEPEQLMSTVLDLAKKIASKGPKAVKYVKQLARNGSLIDFDSGCAMESEKFGSLFGNEAKEGMQAFLEKRPAQWS
jgi:enoyl-CoA hydratase